MLPDLVLRDGFWWPKGDKECHPAVMRTYKDADIAIAKCKQKRVAIQAGGNCGIWAHHLSQFFETVYTFEPDHMNFMCLNLNATQPNIIKMQAALGMKNKPVNMIHINDNIGAHRIGGRGGNIPVIRIDDLRLPALDFLQLDIEGYEYFALKGALHTIENFKPVIMIEDKGHHQKYGVEKASIDDLFEALGYIPYDKVNRDKILIHSDLSPNA